MAGVSSEKGVSDYSFTTSGVAVEVVAQGDVGGLGVVTIFSNLPKPFNLIVTEAGAGNNITTEAGLQLATEST